VILDIPRGVQRDDRGLPAPIFSGIDQYLISTTPVPLDSFGDGFDDGFE
jgi:hypothetical protein